MATDKRLDQSLRAASGELPVGRARPPVPPRPPAPAANVARAAAPSAHAAARVRAEAVADAFDHETAVRFAFVGAGQGGGRIAQAFWDVGYRRVAAFNTTDSDFAGLADELPRFSLGVGGAAKDMAAARAAMRGRDEEVWDLFTRAWGRSFDRAVVCVGLGGGSGGGACVPLVRLARRYMESHGLAPRVGAVVSLPGVDEGRRVARNAVEAFAELAAERVSPLVVIDNDAVDALYRPPMAHLLPKSNELVSRLLHLFNRLAATKSRHITFDRSEFEQVLDAGLVVFGSADLPTESIAGPADVSQAIKEQLAASVLARVDPRTAKKAACVFVAGSSVLEAYGKEYFAAGFTMIDRVVGSAHAAGDAEVVVHRGLYQEGDDGLQCYVLIGGAEPPFDKLAALARVGGLPEAEVPHLARHLRVA